MAVSKSSLKKHYIELHDHRIRLKLAGMLSESESDKVKQRIEKWGEKQGLNTVSVQLAKKKKAPSVDKA